MGLKGQRRPKAETENRALMTVVKIVIVIAVIAIIGWLLARMQSYSEEKYGFPPFSLFTFVLMAVGWVFFLSAIYVLPEQSAMSDVYAAMKALSFPESISNSIALVSLSGITFLCVFGLVAIKTNPIFALIATIFQAIGALLIVPFLIFLIPGGKKKRRRQRTI